MREEVCKPALFSRMHAAATLSVPTRMSLQCLCQRGLFDEQGSEWLPSTACPLSPCAGNEKLGIANHLKPVQRRCMHSRDLMERPVCFRDSGLQTGVRRRKYKLKLGPTKQLVSDPDVVQMEREAQADTLRSGTATSLLVDCTTKMLNKEHCKLNAMHATLNWMKLRGKPRFKRTKPSRTRSSGYAPLFRGLGQV